MRRSLFGPPGSTGRTLRLRLTILYGILFLVSGVGLVAVTDAVTQWFPPEPPPGHGLVASVPGPADHRAGHHRGGLGHAGLGWCAGRILRPLQAITAATRQISERRPAPSGWPSPDPTTSSRTSATPSTACSPGCEAAFDAQRQLRRQRLPRTAHPAHAEPAPCCRWPWPTPPTTPRFLRPTCEEVLDAGTEQEQHDRGAAHPGPQPARPRPPRASSTSPSITERCLLRSREPDAAAAGGADRQHRPRSPPRRTHGEPRLLETASRQPDRQRDPAQHLLQGSDRHPGHRQRRPATAEDHQHRPRHRRQRDHADAPTPSSVGPGAARPAATA